MTSVVRAAWFEAEDAASVAEHHRTATDGLDGVGRVATYSIVRPYAEFQAMVDRCHALGDHPEAAASNTLTLVEFADVGSCVAAEPALRKEEGTRKGATPLLRAALCTISDILGKAHRDGDPFGPIIQFGQFNMPTLDAEADLSRWYEEDRLVRFAGVEGGIHVRRFLSLWGPTKFGILYEFDSVEAHRQRFVSVLEAQAHDNQHSSGGIVDQTIHSVVSPTLGELVAST